MGRYSEMNSEAQDEVFEMWKTLLADLRRMAKGLAISPQIDAQTLFVMLQDQYTSDSTTWGVVAASITFLQAKIGANTTEIGVPSYVWDPSFSKEDRKLLNKVLLIMCKWLPYPTASLCHILPQVN
jgi:hypothetical protein